MNQILVTEKVIVTPEFKRKRKVYKFNFFLSVFLACTLVSCYIYAEYDRNKSEQVSQEILLGLEQEELDDTSISVDGGILVVRMSNTQKEESTKVNVSDLIPETEQNTKMGKIEEFTASDGKSYYIEATLRIPSLDINYPVLSDSSDELLKISINKLWGPNPNEVGNYVIVGHNYKNKTMFGKLPGIDIGATIELEDLSGRTITYMVYDKYEIKPTELQCTSQLTNGKKEITLITCNSNGKKRIVVKGTEIVT